MTHADRPSPMMQPGCPPESDLLRLALAGPPPGDGIARHAAGCEACSRHLAALRLQVEGLRATAGTSASGDGECLDETALVRFLEGLESGPVRDRQLAHVAGCGKCRRQLAALSQLVGDADVARELRAASARHPLRRRGLAAAVVLAAAAVLLLVVLPRPPVGPEPDHRGPTITAGDAPTPITPVGDVSEAPVLGWTAVAGASRYRVTLYSTAGDLLLEVEGVDTIVPIPDSVPLRRGESYLWQVEARTGPDRWTASELMEFRLGPAPADGAGAGPPPDSLHLAAARLTDSALAVAVRTRSSEVREAIGLLLLAAARATPERSASALATARRLALAHAAAWGDDFLAREVSRFDRWPARVRVVRVEADSLRRAGVAAFGREGAEAALVRWRLGLARSAAIGDTAGIAATLGNIGSAHLQEDRIDSAEAALRRARSLATLVGDRWVEANAASGLAWVAEARNDLAAASRLYGQAVELRQRTGDSRGLASDHNNLAGLARLAGDPEGARRHLEAALALNRRDGRADPAATNLVNLASLATLRGDLAEADALYREASATWRRRQRWADLADAERGLGELSIRRGAYPAARAHLREALVLFDRTGPQESAIEVREALARVRAAEGDLQGALDELDAAERIAGSSPTAVGIRARLTLARAELAAALNQEADAARLYASATRLYRDAGDRGGQAEAQKGEGIHHLGQDDATRARARFEAALQLQLSSEDTRGAALTRMWLAAAQLQAGDTGAAREELTQASLALEKVGDPVAAAAALGERAGLELASGFPGTADSLYRAARRRLGSRAVPEVGWRLDAGLAAVREQEGRTDAAATEYRAAIAAIESAGRSLALPERRSGYLADKWEVFTRLALLEQSRGRAAESFTASERLRANELRELLEHGKVAVPRDAAAELLSREQDLRRHITELSREAALVPGGRSVLRGPDVERGRPTARAALLRAQEQYASLLLQLRERAPRRTAMAAPEPVAWRSVARQLGPDQALVEYLTGEEGTLAYVITPDTVAAIRLGVDRRHLARSVALARATLLPRAASRLDAPWRAPLRQLHRDLMAPIEATGLLARARRLVIVPHAELHYLPFAALLDGATGDRFLVERYEVTVAPSASIWLALGSRPATNGTSGILVLVPDPEALPGSGTEAAAIAARGGTPARVLRGGAATEAAFRREAAGRRVIHIASFGILNKQNPLFSFVRLGAGAGQDGELNVHEVFGLQLEADLVVLSACQTGVGSGALGDVPAGDDWVGLTQAFHAAGAGQVVATLWPVQDRATAALMTRFYEAYLGGGDAGRALTAAQRALLADPATANPWFWAGFTLSGGA